MPDSANSNHDPWNGPLKELATMLKTPRLKATDVEGSERQLIQAEFDSDLQTIGEQRRQFDRLMEVLSGNLDRHSNEDSESASAQFDTVYRDAENVLTAEVLAKDTTETLRILRDALGKVLAALREYMRSVTCNLYSAGVLGHIEETSNDLCVCVFVEASGIAGPDDAVAQLLSEVEGTDENATDATASEPEVEEVIHRHEFFIEERYRIGNLPLTLRSRRSVAEILSNVPAMLASDIAILRGREFRDRVSSGATSRNVRDICVITLMQRYAIRLVPSGRARPIRRSRATSNGWRRTASRALQAVKVPSVSAIAVVIALLAITVYSVHRSATHGEHKERRDDQPAMQMEQAVQPESNPEQEATTATDDPNISAVLSDTNNNDEAVSRLQIDDVEQQLVLRDPIDETPSAEAVPCEWIKPDVVNAPAIEETAEIIDERSTNNAVRMTTASLITGEPPSQTSFDPIANDATMFYGMMRGFDERKRVATLWRIVFAHIPDEHRTVNEMASLAYSFQNWYRLHGNVSNGSYIRRFATDFEQRTERYGLSRHLEQWRAFCHSQLE